MKPPKQRATTSPPGGFKAVAAGTFLYVATLDIVREEFFPGGSNRGRRLIWAILGAGIMALVAIWM